MYKMLKEKTVQEKALHFLKKHYRWKARGGRIFARMEMSTRQKFGGKRADGILAYRNYLGRLRVISLEAKSQKTLRAIQPRRRDSKLIWRSILVGLAVCLGSGAFMFLLKMDDPYLRVAVPANIFVAAALAYGYFSFTSSRHKSAAVLTQLSQYPANRQWIACSADSVKVLKPELRKQLKSICQHQGYGLLIVHPNGKVKRWLNPRFRRKWPGNFLQYYSKEKEIRKKLSG